MTSPGARNGAASLWYARHRAPGGGAVFVAVSGTEFPADTVVELPGPAVRPATWQCEAHVPVPGRAPTRVLTSQDVAAQAPHLWTVLGPAGDGDQLDLVAFSTADLPDGTVTGSDALTGAGPGWGDQVAAVRWSPSTGLVGQVYVAPQHRRRRVATKLLLVLAGVRVALGGPSLHSDGRLTDLGDAWLGRQPDWWRERIPARTEHLPPMTPPAEAVGVPARALEVDRR